MGALEEIRKMQEQGRSEQEITFELASRGYPASEIRDSMAHAKIKEAVGDGMQNPNIKLTKTQTNSQEMTPSMLGEQLPREQSEQASNSGYSMTGQDYVDNQQDPQPPGQQQAYSQTPPQYAQQEPQTPPQYAQQEQAPLAPDYQDPYAQSEQPQYAQQDYPAYQQSGMSQDMISEITEQVFAEKLSPLKTKLEEALSFKNIIESKVDYLDERIKRIEKIIDRLQLSVLQKVGEYMTNVEDIKKELVETQKSFKAMSQDRRKTSG